MSIPSVSPLGTASFYSSFKADKAPPDTSVPEQSKAQQTGIDKQSIDGNSSTPDDRSRPYGYTNSGKPAEQTAAVEGENDSAGTSKATDQEDSKSSGPSKTEPNPNDSEYTPEEQKQITSLKARNTEVKAHEQAHIAAGGQYVNGGAHFEYQTGPDGKKYAIGGEVSIDASKESGDPQATIAKMQTIVRAALAPASPSGQDRAVAAKASRIEMEARTEAMAQTQSQSQDEPKQTHTESRGTDAYTTGMNTSPAKPLIDLFS